MANPRVVGILDDDEHVEMWRVVKEHYGHVYSQSAIVKDLIRKKYFDITDDDTGRSRSERTDRAVHLILKILMANTDVVKIPPEIGDELDEVFGRNQ